MIKTINATAQSTFESILKAGNAPDTFGHMDVLSRNFFFKEMEKICL